MKCILLISLFTYPLITLAQSFNCTFKPPVFTIHFGSGNVRDVNNESLYNYRRVSSSCPTDGHYTYASYTSDCFSGDWFTLDQDHTAGDVDGNMLLINAAYSGGTFLRTPVIGLKGNTTYEFAVWMMNVCKISDKCPFPLLPDISIQLLTPDGKGVSHLKVGEVPRKTSPSWTRYTVLFTTPPSATDLKLVMTNNSPGGCGNDFAVDDITFRECIKQPLTVTAAKKTTQPKNQPVPNTSTSTKKPPPSIAASTAKKQPSSTVATPPKKQSAEPKASKKTIVVTDANPPATKPVSRSVEANSAISPVAKPEKKIFPPPPPVLRTRENALEKRILAEAGEIRIDLYDNGEIDGDTVSIYHNNVLLKSHARLALNPITLRITINADQPHHELIMVAENLGSIPPNTSLMVVNTGTSRYEVRISSNEQKNAKVVFDLKE